MLNKNRIISLPQSKKRLDFLTRKLWARLKENVLLSIGDLVSYPGGFEFITFKDIRKSGCTNAVAYIVRVYPVKEEKLKSDKPFFAVKIVKEWFDSASDKEILFVVAHELSHAVMRIGNDKWNEYAADILAEHFFKIKKPGGSTLGYLYDKNTLKKI